MRTGKNLDGIWYFFFSESADFNKYPGKLKFENSIAVPGCFDVMAPWFGKRGTGYFRRLVHTGGTVRFRQETNSRGIILAALDKSFREKVNPGLLVRRIGLSLNDPKAETGAVQTDMFTDPEEQDRERRIQEAMIGVRGRFGRNALVRGMSLLEGATAMERNEQIGGHRA